MATIQTKYDIGQAVYTATAALKGDVVEGIQYGSKGIRYKLAHGMAVVAEAALYPTKEDARQAYKTKQANEEAERQAREAERQELTEQIKELEKKRESLGSSRHWTYSYAFDPAHLDTSACRLSVLALAK